MKNVTCLLLTIAALVTATGCSSPCDDLKDECQSCDDPANCEGLVEFIDQLGGGDACEQTNADELCNPLGGG